jgi:hypothetical protein
MEQNKMSDRDQEWTYEGELFELRNWSPRRASLGPHWRSIASDALPRVTETSIPNTKKTDE